MADGHVYKHRRLAGDFAHMGKDVQGDIGGLNTAQFLGTAHARFGDDGYQVGFLQGFDMESHGGHGKIKSFRKLADSHGFGYQAFQYFQTGFR